MASQIFDRRTIGIPGPVTPEAVAARDEAVDARDRAESFSAAALASVKAATDAKNDAVTAKEAAQAVGATNDAIMAGVAADTTSSFSRQLDMDFSRYDSSRRVVHVPNGNILVAGDSIAAQCPTESAAILVGRYERVSWLDWAATLLDQRIRVTRNAGVGGNTTDMLLARLEADVLSAPEQIVALNIGVNDLFNGKNATADHIKVNLKRIVDLIVASGKHVAWNTTAPSGHVTSGRKLVQDEVNDFIRSYAASLRGSVTLVDMYPAVVDGDGTGRPWAGYARPEDNPTSSFRGVHPGLFGASAMGKVWARAMRHVVPREVSVLGSALKGAATFPGGTGGIAEGWLLQSVGGGAVAGSVLPSKGWRSVDGRAREVQQVVRASVSDGARLWAQNTAVGVDWSVGQTATLRVRYEMGSVVEAAQSGAGFGLRLNLWNAVGAQYGITFPGNDFLGITPTGFGWLGGVRTFQTPPCVIPAGTQRPQAEVGIPLGTHRVIEADILLS